MNYGGQIQEASKGKNVSNGTRDHSCDILKKNVATFCLHTINFHEAKLKHNELISLAEEI